MLEKLDAIDWKRLAVADGDAGAIPGLIRALTSDDEEVREHDRHELSRIIWDNATACEATAYAVPFLVELLAHPDVAGKTGILLDLSYIAGSRSLVESRHRTGSPPSGPEDDRQREARLARERDWILAACAAVEAGAPTYLDLLDHEDPEVRIHAAHTLGHCPGRAGWILPRLVARVADEKDPRCRASMILAAGLLAEADGGPGPAGPLFAERMRPGEHRIVRLSAAMAAARSSPDGPSAEVVDAMIATAGPAWRDFQGFLPWNAGDDVAVDMGEALDRDPGARLRFLTTLLDSRHGRVRCDALEAVDALARACRSITRGVAAALGDRIATARLADRRHLVEILSRLGSAASAAAGPLAVAMGDDDPDVRTHAALALAGLGDPRAVPVLIERLGDWPTFRRIVGALGAFGDAARDAVPALVAALRDGSGDPFEALDRPSLVAEALGRIGPGARSAIPALIELMDEQPYTLGFAAEAIARIGGPSARDAIPFLKEMLRSPREGDSIAAARALWRIEGRADVVLPVLIERLRDGDRCRDRAAEALGELGEAAREAIPALFACLEDRSFDAGWVRLQAAAALWRIERRADRALPVLAGLLGDPGSIGAKVATKAVEALGEMGAEAREAVPILREAAAGDLRPFGGPIDEIVTQDEAFLSAVAEALRRITTDEEMSDARKTR